jgi:glycosyltransferase involved in cell wall biosynthesis
MLNAKRAVKMNQTIPAYTRFKELGACVLIPTYNNSASLPSVINDVLQYTDQIIVVNDGSTDNTAALLQNFPCLQIITQPVNKGKGFALRTGFDYAYKRGYQYAISIDSDGQHFAKDLYKFLDKLEEASNAIIIGARNMDQGTVPGKSSFGNRFSNFWFKIETGMVMPDTQSGYRLYPLKPLQKIHFFTRRFEFEIEVLVRAAWKGIGIVSVPVTVYYAPKETRVSHFRPVRDFTRISILNTFLVLVTLLYIIPRNFLLGLFNKKARQQFLNQHLLNPHHSDELKAISIAFGVFMGILPVWGFQLALAVFLSIILKLNKGLVIIAANISIPPMIPPIIFLSYKMGAWWMGDHAMHLVFSKNISLQDVKANLQQYIYGSITLAVIAALVLGVISYLLMKIFKRKMLVAA